MPEITIPHFKLNDMEATELINAIKDMKIRLEDYYRPLYLKVREAKYAKNTKNAPKALLSVPLFGGKDQVVNRPDIHLPLLKDIANANIAEFVQSIFTNDFLSVQSVDQRYKYLETDVTEAFNAVREETRTDEKEIQIIDDVCWQGTCPVVIENTGRYNAVHEIINVWQLEITQELKQFIFTLLSSGVPLPPEINMMLQGLLNANYIQYKEEDVEYEKQVFKGAIATSDTGMEILREVEDYEHGIPALILLIDQLEQMFINPQTGEKILDCRNAKIVEQQIRTTEKFIQGLPKPKILNLLQTYVVPACIKDDPDTVSWMYIDFKKTQDLADDPSFMNLDKLNQGGTLIGKTCINPDVDGYQNSFNSNTSSNYISTEPICEFKQAYFDQFRFKTSTNEDGTPKVLRNFIVSTVEDQYVIECKPNVSCSEVSGVKMSKNPLILVTYYKNSNENIGTSPILDSLDLSKASNILMNYALDTMARNGNKYAYFSNVVDIKTMNGGTATLVEINGYQAKKFGIQNVQQAFQAIDSNNNDAIQAINTITIFRDQIQQLSNSSQPYFQSKKGATATEVATIANQATGMVASRIKHIAKSLCDLYQRMFDDCVDRGIKIERVPCEENGESSFRVFDFGELKGKKFIIRITSLNPQLSKAVQANVMKELLVMAIESQMPEVLSRVNVSEMTQEILKLSGIIKPDLTRNDDEAKKWVLENDQKEQLFQAVTSGQYTLVPAQPAIGAGQQGIQPAVPQGQGKQTNSPQSGRMGVRAA